MENTGEMGVGGQVGQTLRTCPVGSMRSAGVVGYLREAVILCAWVIGAGGNLMCSRLSVRSR